MTAAKKAPARRTKKAKPPAKAKRAAPLRAKAKAPPPPPTPAPRSGYVFQVGPSEHKPGSRLKGAPK
jgi:hypothetical protein